MDSNEILEEDLKSSIRDIYRAYSDEVGFAGYLISGSAVAAAISVGFGLPLAGALAGNAGGVVIKYIVDKVRDKKFKEDYEEFLDYVTKREVILAPLNTYRSNTAAMYKSAIKPHVNEIFEEINRMGRILLTKIEKAIVKIGDDGESKPLIQMRDGIEAAMRQKIVNKGENDFILESPFIVGAATRSVKFAIRLVKKSASTRAKKVLIDLKNCSSKKEVVCIKTNLIKLQSLICKDYMDDFIDEKEFSTITKMILTSYENEKIGDEFKSLI